VSASAEERRDALVGKLFTGAIEALDVLSVYLGDRLGLYRALADGGPSARACSRRPRASTSATRA
jgi:hypothetical protein